MEYDLVVTHEFGAHFVGERIIDRDEVDTILAGHNASFCVKVPAEAKPESVADPAPLPKPVAEDDGKGVASKK